MAFPQILRRHCVTRWKSGHLQRLFTSLRPVQDRDVDIFRSMLGASHVLEDSESLEPRNVDWTRHYRGNAKVVLQPESVEQVSGILGYCQKESLGIVPQGGRTGLVGGGVATGGSEVILSLDRLNKIEQIDKTNGILRCQAGCILQNVQDFAKEHNFLVPIDLGSKGTCQIGGNLSTNAGGQFYYRYGSLAGNVLGVEVVLADGRILDLNYSRPNMKDNTGYKLHQIFLGAEGTLGIITAAAIVCPSYPSSQQAVLLAFETFENVLQALTIARAKLGETLGAVEFMDQTIVELIQQAGHRIPLVRNEANDKESNVYPYYLLVETHGCVESHNVEKMEGFLETLMTDEFVVDGVPAQDETQRQHFWSLREAANPTFGKVGYGYKYDISVPVSDWESFCTDLRSHLADNLPSDVKWVQGNWGHIMDGNLHWNLATPGMDMVDPRVLEQVEDPLFDRVLSRHGSISAEHGLGQSKNRFLDRVHNQAALHTMRELKNLWDPKGILNPGKVLPPP